MSSESANCQPELLEQLLCDQLPELQEQRVSEHLGECSACQQRLESLAGSHDDWQRVRGALTAEVERVSHAGLDPAATTIASPERQHVSVEPGAEAVVPLADFAVSFLRPGDRPDSVGRLDNIEIESVIGRGGNGLVLKGFQEDLNRPVAVKVMSPHLAASGAARQRFAREARATAAIVHPAVMPILSVDADGQLPYLVMPFVDCESLQQRIDRIGPMQALDLLRVAHQVAGGLAAAHAQGLVHRDVKPANILLERKVDRVMLTDFGLARAVDDATLTRSGLIAGTPQYMSPEQARGEVVDTSSDLFSLGSVMYAMCTGRPPFRAETSYGILRRVTDHVPHPIRDLNPEIPRWLERLVTKLMAKTPEHRFGSAAEVAEILEDCVAHVQHPTVNALPGQIADGASSLGSRFRTAAGWTAAGALLASVALFADGANNKSAASGGGLRNASHTLDPLAGSIDVPAESAPGSPETYSAPAEVTTVEEAWDAGGLSRIRDLRDDVESLLDDVNREPF